jgi:CHASE2 domain-containing sensor protein
MTSVFGRLIKVLQYVFTVKRGRPFAFGMLMWSVSLNIVTELPVGVTLPAVLDQTAAWLGAPLRNGRQFLFDSYQRNHPREPQSQPVTIVAIDEASLAEYGQWPWPRNRLAGLIDQIARHEPAAIGLDIFMPEADQTSPENVAANLPADQAALAARLRQLPSHDSQLAQALRRTPTVLGAAGFEIEAYATSAGLRTRPLQINGEDAMPYLRQYPRVLASLPELQAAAAGQALLSVDLENGLVRRVPLVQAINGQPVAGMAMELLRVASHSSAVEVDVSRHGIEQVGVADLRVPTQPRGDIWLHFARLESTAARYVSAIDVLSGRIDPERLAGRLVLIGLTGSGLNDMRTTALGELVPGIEIQAQTIETLFDGRFLLRPWWMKWLETTLLLALGLLMIWFVPQTNSHFAVLLRTIPRASMWLTLAVNMLIISAGYWIFRNSGLLFDASAFFIVVSSVMGSLIASAFLEMDRQAKALAEEQHRLREDAALLAGVMGAARRNKLGNPQPAATANDPRYQVAACLQAATPIRGDFYDHFMLDDQRLCVVMGDASGRGVARSLFAEVNKNLPAKVAAEGVADAPDEVFGALLIGVLDLQVGSFALLNAGHLCPWRLPLDGEITQTRNAGQLAATSLARIEDFSAHTQHLQLAPGEKVCLCSDGVISAANTAQAGFSEARVATLLAQGRAATPAELVTSIHSELTRFAGDMAADDDWAALVVQWLPSKEKLAE